MGGQIIPGPAPVLVAASATPTTIYGPAGSSAISVASFTIPGGSLKPSSLLELTADWDFALPNHAGRTIQFLIGGQTIGQAFPAATVGSLQTKHVVYVAPDLQSLTVQTQSLNNVSSPTTGQGAPFEALTATSNTLTVDLTADQTLTLNLTPTNDDIATLNGFSLVNHGFSTPRGYAPSNALAVWGDSLTAGTGTTGTFILNTTGTTTSGSNSITSAGSITGILPGQLISGPGIPAGTIVLSAASTTIVMSKNATAPASGVAVKVQGGALPQQLMYLLAGRPLANLGVAGNTSAQILTRFLRDRVRGHLWRTLIWAGRNDVGSGSLTATVTANVAAMVANLAPGAGYLVGTVIPSANEGTGSANYIAIQALNAQLNTTYGAKVADIFAALTAGGTTNVPLQYRACTNTTGTISSGSPTLTVASATGLSVGMYCISPGSTAIADGTTSTAPTITNIAGTTITLSANASAPLTTAMVSFIGSTEVHLNDLGYSVVRDTVSTALTANGL